MSAAEGQGWDVFIVPDEETGSRESKPLLELVAGRCHLGLVFEPALSDGSKLGERMGSGAFRITIHRLTAHAGYYPENGHSALEAVADVIMALRELKDRRKGIRLSIGEVRGGGPVNIVPDKAICRFSVRVSGYEEMEYKQAGIQRIVQIIDRREGFSADLVGKFGRPPKILDDASKYLLDHVIACGSEMGLSVEWKSSGGVSVGTTLVAAGLPNLDNFGPVGAAYHTPEENIIVSTVVERAELTALFLMKLARGKIP